MLILSLKQIANLGPHVVVAAFVVCLCIRAERILESAPANSTRREFPIRSRGLRREKNANLISMLFACHAHLAYRRDDGLIATVEMANEARSLGGLGFLEVGPEQVLGLLFRPDLESLLAHDVDSGGG